VAPLAQRQCLKYDRHSWVEEVVCEAGSQFALLALQYADDLPIDSELIRESRTQKHFEEQLAREEKNCEEILSPEELPHWLLNLNLSELELDNHIPSLEQRRKYGTIGKVLVQHLCENPGGLNALCYIRSCDANLGTGSTRDFLRDWLDGCKGDDEAVAFVEMILALFFPETDILRRVEQLFPNQKQTNTPSKEDAISPSKETKEEEDDPEVRCVLTGTIPQDPVKLCGANTLRVYEKSALAEHLSNTATDPASGEIVQGMEAYVGAIAYVMDRRSFASSRSPPLDVGSIIDP